MKYILLAFVAACGALFWVYCQCFDDVVEWDVATIERNCPLSCRHLDIAKSFFDTDYNILTIHLNQEPSSAFYQSLREQGWQPSGESYTHGLFSLRYDFEDKCIIIR